MRTLKANEGTCSLCEKFDEEDKLLVIHAITSTDPKLDIWCHASTIFLTVEGPSVLKDIFKLSNFHKLINDIFLVKYNDVAGCKHPNMSRALASFIREYKVDESKSPANKEAKQEELFNKNDLNKAFKDTWKKMIDLKSEFFEIEYQLSTVHSSFIRDQLLSNEPQLPKVDANQIHLQKRAPVEEEDEEGLEDSAPLKQKRYRFPKHATTILRNWFLANLSDPKPDYKYKVFLAKATGLDVKQVEYWFTNARKRYLEPFLTNQVALREVTSKLSPFEWNQRLAGAGITTLQSSMLSTVSPQREAEGTVEKVDWQQIYTAVRKLSAMLNNSLGDEVGHGKNFDDVDPFEPFILEAEPVQTKMKLMPPPELLRPAIMGSNLMYNPSLRTASLTNGMHSAAESKIPEQVPGSYQTQEGRQGMLLSQNEAKNSEHMGRSSQIAQQDADTPTSIKYLQSPRNERRSARSIRPQD